MAKMNWDPDDIPVTNNLCVPLTSKIFQQYFSTTMEQALVFPAAKQDQVGGDGIYSASRFPLGLIRFLLTQ